MLLSLTAIDLKGKVRTFSSDLPDLESGFDLLSYTANKGHVLITARLINEHNRIYIPVAVVDKNPVSPFIRKLEKEWKEVLDEPVDLRSVFCQPDTVDPGDQAEMIHSIVYYSTPVGLFQGSDLLSILLQSRSHNRNVNNTGVLLCLQDYIIQVLEGPKIRD